MDKNFFLAIFLSVLVYIGWFSFIEKNYPKPVPARPARTAPGPDRNAVPAGETALAPAVPDRAPDAGGLDGALAFSAGDVELRIQPLGAGMVSYLYPDPLGPVELIETPFPGFFSTFEGLAFKRTGNDKNWPTFEAALSPALSVRKEYVLQAHDSIHTLRLTFSNSGPATARVPSFSLNLGPGMGTVKTEEKENAQNWKAVALLVPEKEGKRDVFEEFDLEEETAARAAPWRWLGVENRYFLAAVFPPEERFDRFETGTRKQTVLGSSWLGGSKKVEALAPWLKVRSKPIDVPAGEEVAVEIPFYFGPKGYGHLKALGHGLERSVSFGWFQSLGKFTLHILSAFHRWTGNWGWAIVLLTLCLQVVMFPLTYKSTKSMLLMKKVAPEQAKLQQKFKNNPQRLQQEMMALYKRHGVNPLGGCLPMLAQMPIFIALFNMLRGAWELHGAPWMFWITDLSAADPFYVLPIVMGGIMYLQNSMNPSMGGDPNQQKMMKFMPVIFTFMFLNFPAGLVLYWLTNSILSFAQQLVIKKRLGA